jgi:hypothetical protein
MCVYGLRYSRFLFPDAVTDFTLLEMPDPAYTLTMGGD